MVGADQLTKVLSVSATAANQLSMSKAWTSVGPGLVAYSGGGGGSGGSGHGGGGSASNINGYAPGQGLVSGQGIAPGQGLAPGPPLATPPHRGGTGRRSYRSPSPSPGAFTASPSPGAFTTSPSPGAFSLGSFSTPRNGTRLGVGMGGEVRSSDLDGSIFGGSNSGGGSNSSGGSRSGGGSNSGGGSTSPRHRKRRGRRRSSSSSREEEEEEEEEVEVLIGGLEHDFTTNHHHHLSTFSSVSQDIQSPPSVSSTIGHTTTTTGTTGTVFTGKPPSDRRGHVAAAKRIMESTPSLQCLPDHFQAAIGSSSWSIRQQAVTHITECILAYPEVLKDAGKLESCVDRLIERLEDGSVKVGSNHPFYSIPILIYNTPYHTHTMPHSHSTSYTPIYQDRFHPPLLFFLFFIMHPPYHAHHTLFYTPICQDIKPNHNIYSIPTLIYNSPYHIHAHTHLHTLCPTHLLTHILHSLPHPFLTTPYLTTPFPTLPPPPSYPLTSTPLYPYPSFIFHLSTGCSIHALSSLTHSHIHSHISLPLLHPYTPNPHPSFNFHLSSFNRWFNTRCLPSSRFKTPYPPCSPALTPLP